MDSGGKKNQDDMKKFEEFLKGYRILRETDPDKRFIELILSVVSDTLFCELRDRNINPNVVSEYLNKRENIIKKNIFKENTFLYDLFKKHVNNTIFSFNGTNRIWRISRRVYEEKQKEFSSAVPEKNQAIISEHDFNLQENFANFMQLSDKTLYGPRASMDQVVLQQEAGRVFVGMCKFAAETQNIIATQLGLIQQANERADKLQEDLNQQLKTEKERADKLQEDLNQQLKTEKERADKLQEDNKELLANKTSAAVAAKEAEGLKAQLVDKVQLVTTQTQLITAMDAEIERRKEESKQQTEELKQKQEQFNRANANTSEANNNTKLANERLEQAKQFAIQLADVNEELKERIAALEKENAELKKSNCRRK